MNSRAGRTGLALALQVAAVAALAASLLGATWLDERSLPRLLVLVDRSQSMPQTETDAALRAIVREATQHGFGQIQSIGFAGRAALADGTELETGATDIEAALLTALQVHARSRLGGVVVVSDGFENRGHAAAALAAVREAELPLQWKALGRPPPAARIAGVAAPATAQVGQRLELSVQIAGPSTMPLRLQARSRGASGVTRNAEREVSGAGPLMLSFDALAAGPWVIDLTLQDAASGVTLDTRADAAIVEIAPRAPLFYAHAAAAPLADSLHAGGWSLHRVPAARLDAETDALSAYAGVVLDDIAVADASPRFWQALVAAVRDRGLGLLVLGGDRAFTLGGYRGSVLEAVLPLLSEPAALDRPAAVLFAVDKSGSMGQGSDGVDRFEQARRAVVGTASGLTARDAVGLMVFDVVPRLLSPLTPIGPAAAGAEALTRDWRVRPGGGTRIVPLLDAALTELERSDASRRLLVLVTDGFIDNALDDRAVSALRNRLGAAGIETLALAVGADADVSALQRLLGAGAVLGVGQAAGLPDAMRSAVERRRARVERGSITVRQTQPLPFTRGQWSDWPAVAAYPVTRARPGATVALQSQRGDPLVAFQTFGHGRVMAVGPGLGTSTPQWLRWSRWPQLAGGLADWIGAGGVGPAAGVALTEKGDGLQVEIDTPVGVDAGLWALGVETPSGRSLSPALQTSAPGRLRAVLPDAGDGLYRFVLSGPQGSQRQSLLRRRGDETSHWGTAPALATWRAAGWITDWDPQRLLLARKNVSLPPDRSLLLVALVLFVTGVVVDRATLDRAAVGARWRAVLRRLRPPVAAR